MMSVVILTRPFNPLNPKPLQAGVLLPVTFYSLALIFTAIFKSCSFMEMAQSQLEVVIKCLTSYHAIKNKLINANLTSLIIYFT